MFQQKYCYACYIQILDCMVGGLKDGVIIYESEVRISSPIFFLTNLTTIIRFPLCYHTCQLFLFSCPILSFPFLPPTTFVLSLHTEKIKWEELGATLRNCQCGQRTACHSLQHLCVVWRQPKSVLTCTTVLLRTTGVFQNNDNAS
jgi:hypothetical protein